MRNVNIHKHLGWLGFHPNYSSGNIHPAGRRDTRRVCSHPDHVGKETLACHIQLVSSEFGDTVEYLHLHATSEYLRQQRCHAFFVETVELLVQPRVAL